MIERRLLGDCNEGEDCPSREGGVVLSGRGGRAEVERAWLDLLETAYIPRTSGEPERGSTTPAGSGGGLGRIRRTHGSNERKFRERGSLERGKAPTVRSVNYFAMGGGVQGGAIALPHYKLRWYY